MFKVIISYLCIYLVWGSTYFFMKMAVSSLPVPLVLAMRFTIGGILLFAIALIQGKGSAGLFKWKTLVWSILVGILLLLTGNGMVTIAVKTVDSYMAALIIATTPMIVMIFDRVFWGKKLSWNSYLGAILGLIGIALLMYRGTSVPFSFSFHSALVIVGAISWGLATSISKRVPIISEPLVNSAVQSLSCGLIAMLLLLGSDPGSAFAVLQTAPFKSLFAVLYLGILGGISFYAFGYLLKHEPNHRVVSYALVNPVIAVAIGLLVGNESRVPFLWPAIGTILGGLLLMFYGSNLRFDIQKS